MASKLEILAYEDSPLGTLCLRRRELLKSPGTFVTEVTLNHEFLMSSLYTDSERELARIAIERHGGTDLSVLIGGLGLGYTAQATLASGRVGKVEVAELLPEVIDWMRKGLVPLSEELNADERLQTTPCDVYRRLCGPRESRFDLILIDVDHSPEERLGEQADDFSQMFYTERGLRLAKQHLTPGGMLAVWSYDQSSPFVDALHAVFGEVHVQDVSYQNDLVDERCTDWLFFAR
ncbi:spermidine synthase [Planctomycetes bacterium K23_9]|uniref:Spermidine synthase n=1 Tax=Stieleria marina TaxID=1930275 RepID=A0A517NZT3_9BACT|nr:Spermidine synthase [Planctomycetes bacterium K23_9]